MSTVTETHIGMLGRHVDEAAFLWEHRRRILQTPSFDLEALADFDDRLEAHLEGIVLAGALGVGAAMDRLDHVARHAWSVGGELFAALLAAAEVGDTMALGSLLARAEVLPHGERAAISALEWLSPRQAAHILAQMLDDACAPSLRLLGIGGACARRRDPGDSLRRALSADDPTLRSRAFRGVGELGRRDLLPVLRSEIEAGTAADPWAVWSAAVLGEGAAVPLLWSLAADDGAFATVAASTAAQISSSVTTAKWLRSLGATPKHSEAALAGAAAWGDPACMSWVLELFAGPPTTHRGVAWVVATITGVPLVPPLTLLPSGAEPTDRELAVQRKEELLELPAPNAEAITRYWARARHQFPEGRRFLGGQAIEVASLERCLRTGILPWRELAARELLFKGARPSLFPVFAPAHRQAAVLSMSIRKSTVAEG